MTPATASAIARNDALNLNRSWCIIEDPHRIAPDYTGPVSVVGDARWDLSPLSRKSTIRDTRSINFDTFPECFRDTAKRLIWACINLATPIEELDRATATRTRLSAGSVVGYSFFLRTWMQWVAEQGVTAFCEVTEHHFEQYAGLVSSLGLDRASQANRLFAITRTWLYAPYLPESDRLTRPSWEGGEGRANVLGEANWSAENRTPPIHPQTMSALIVWSMRFVNDFSDDILAAKALKETPQDPGPEFASLAPYQRFLAYLRLRQQRYGTLPGWNRPQVGMKRCIASAFIGWKLGIAPAFTKSMPLADKAPDLDPREEAVLPLAITGTIDAKPWIEAINFYDVDKLCCLLATSAFVVVAYLTGMRGEECRALERGCCRTTIDPQSGQTRHAISGRTFKAALDADGNSIPEGTQREQPWRAIEPVAKAVAVMEKLQPDSRLLFPTTAFSPQRSARDASAVAPRTVRDRIIDLINWCNQQAERLERGHEAIPPDSEGPVTVRRFRRTLAWFVYRKPGGRIALGVQYGHLRGHTTDGYGSRVSSGLRDVFPMEEALAAAEFLQGAYDRMQNGERVTGPAAKRYTEGIQLYHNKFGGRYLTNRQAAALRSNPKLRIYDSADQFVTCCYDQAKALCHPDRRAANGIEQTPDVTNCKPNCGNVARTDTNIARAETAVSLHRSEIDDPATPLPMRARLEQRVTTLQSIIDQHRANQ